MSKTTLVGFLGNVGKPNAEGKRNYNQVDYRFENGTIINDYLFSFALLKYLRKKVDKLVLLGTTGSMWDNLFEHEKTVGILPDELQLQLMYALDPNEESHQVTQELLDELAIHLGKALGFECSLNLIPEGNNQDEQLQTLQAIMSHFSAHKSSKDVAILDITHGFRHLPMLSILSALLLKTVYKIKIDGLYYGKLMGNSAEVIKLDGLLDISDWLVAFSRFGATGNYGVFADLLKKDGVDKNAVESLKQASFYDSILQVAHVNNEIKAFKTHLSDKMPQKGLSAMFIETLKQRLEWTTQGKYHERQLKMAQVYLSHKNYLEASCLGYEALLSQKLYEFRQSGVIQDQLDPRNFDHRDTVKKTWKSRESNSIDWQNFNLLRGLRNSIVHGSNANNSESNAILVDAQKLHQTLVDIVGLPSDDEI